MIRPDDEPINNADTGCTTMIGLPSREQWDGKEDKCANLWFNTATEKHWKRMFIGSR